MALRIRLARGGAKKRPFYRMVVTDSRNPRDGAFLEKVGTYDPFLPHENSSRIVTQAERIKYWISVGAKPSDRVAILLGQAGVCEKPMMKNNPQKAIPKKKAQERLKEAADATAAAATSAE